METNYEKLEKTTSVNKHLIKFRADYQEKCEQNQVLTQKLFSFRRSLENKIFGFRKAILQDLHLFPKQAKISIGTGTMVVYDNLHFTVNIAKIEVMCGRNDISPYKSGDEQKIDFLLRFLPVWQQFISDVHKYICTLYHERLEELNKTVQEKTTFLAEF